MQYPSEQSKENFRKWREELKRLTRYYNEQESPEETYKKIDKLKTKGFNREKAMQDIEYAKMVVLTPGLKEKQASTYFLSDSLNFIREETGDIISRHPELIEIIGQHADLTTKYLKYLNSFIGSTLFQNTYSDLRDLIKTENPFLKKFLEGKEVTFSQLQDAILSPEEACHYITLDH